MSIINHPSFTQQSLVKLAFNSQKTRLKSAATCLPSRYLVFDAFSSYDASTKERI